ncbi:MAG: arylsulfatase [Kiritimatiellae bacterium]|nr:arylsulfatase [Kiritimatiellia bacterium]MDD5519890.1 arylsulfatase [Kiritimatiellia bacterium]
MSRQTFSRRDFIGMMGFGVGAFCLPGNLRQSFGAENSEKRPNIIVILTDDMGFSDLGCYGSEIGTPNLDKLAENGLRFTQFYNTARCCPTRACLLTGLYPHQAAVGHMMQNNGLDGYQGDLSRNAVTIAEALKPAGYSTYCVGKWHVTPFKEKENDKHNWPLQRGFDRYYGIIGGAANYFDPKTLTRDNTSITADSDPDYTPGKYYLTDAISDNAVRFVNGHISGKKEQPFFMYVAYTAAHWPLHAPEDEIARHKGKYEAGYDTIRLARFEREKKLGLINPDWELSPQFGKWDQVVRKDWEARCMEVYAAQVSRMDTGVGKIVESLKKNGLLDNTLIFFLQDNGACAEGVGRVDKQGGQVPMPGPKETWIAYGEAWANVSNTPFRYYKHFVHEGGISTPLIVHWPDRIKRKGEFEKQPGHLIDIMATCVDVSGTKYPVEFSGKQIQSMEGCSLAPAFEDKPLPRKNALFWEHEGNRAIRTADQWKLVAKGPQGPWELYNMEKDRTEMHDLAEKVPDKVKEMTILWEDYAKRTHAVPWPWGKPYGDEKVLQRGKGKKKKKAEK